MKLSEYAEHIAEFAKKYPNAEVVYSADDEGNSFQSIYYHPTVGRFKDGEFISESEMRDENIKGKVNAVCIN